MQLLPPVIAIIGIWFTAESPRWLISKGREAEAIVALRKLRRKEYAGAGVLEAEVEAIADAVEQTKHVKEGGWVELFKGSMWRRTIYAIAMFFFYEAGGNQFYNSYGPTFFVSTGLGAKSFTYAVVCQTAGTTGALMTIFATDRVGRRPLCIFGSALLVIWVTLIGALGSKPDITTNTSAQNGVVASFVLLLWSTKIAYATHAFIVTAELGGVHMRKKSESLRINPQTTLNAVMMIGAATDVISSFAVAFSSPYILNVIGAKIGYIFTVISGAGLLFAIFLLPELRGRSLEEVDELFEKPRFRWAWQFKGAQTTGLGARVAQLQGVHDGGVDTGPETGKSEQPEQVVRPTRHISERCLMPSMRWSMARRNEM
jgi:hypothetical protein